MSKYSIKRIDEPDPTRFGLRRKRIGYMFVLLSVLFMVTMIVIHQVTDMPVGNTNMIILSVFYGITLLYYVKMRNANTRIKDIGSIEFNQTGIVKIIGDIRTEYAYTSIESLNLKKHIPAVSPKEGKKGYFTHILTINFPDRHSEHIVVSDRPAGKFRDLSIAETLETLRRFTMVRIEIS